MTFGAVAALAAVLASATPLAGAMEWRSIGPAIGGGRTTSVAGSNRDPLLYYFGAADGGVWKTTDAGSTWADVWGDKPVASIGAVAIAPSDDRVVWAGTGEPNFRNDVSYGDGVWVSPDAGRSWEHRGLDDTYSISRILVAPHDPNEALAGAMGDPYKDNRERGVFRTVDGGRHWTKTLYVGPRSGVCDLAADRSGRTVFAGVWQFRRVPWTFSSGGPDDGLYRSRDGGITWRRLHGHGLPSGLTGRIGVAVAPSDPRIVYAVIESKAGVLWRSEDGGDSWRLVNSDSYTDQRPFYMSRIAVDPRDPYHVMSMSEDLVESRDGGRSFAIVQNAVHQDHHDLWWSDDGVRLIEADDGGAPLSLDGGETWLWRFNVPIEQFYHVGYDMQNPYRVCGGLQDNDAFCGPSDSLNPLGIIDSDWRDVGNDGDGAWAWPDPTDPDLIWNVGVSSLTGMLGIYDWRTRENYDVSPALPDTNGVPIAGMPYRVGWAAPIAFSPFPPYTAYYGANVVFKSVDRGRTWTVISPDLTRDDASHQGIAGGPVVLDGSGAEFFDTILDIAPSTRNADIIWAGTDDGLVQVTRDAGAHWSRAAMRGIGPYGRVEAVEPSGFSDAAAFAVVDRHLLGDRRPYVYATDDFGATWRRIDAGLPRDEYAHVIRQSRANPDVLFVGLEQGVWVSVDAGRSWSPLASGMPPVAIADLRIQPRDADLIAATHGRGLFILDDIRPFEELASARARDAYLFAPRPAYEFWRWWTSGAGSGEGECCATADRFAGRNPDPGATISYYLRRKLAHPPSLELIGADGRKIRTITGANAAGINRVTWDLAEAPPAPWRSARPWNAGPSDGALVVPGAYLVRLRAGTVSIDQPLAVRPDPRASWTQADYEARHDFSAALLAELDEIDVALNELDASAARHPLTHAQRALYAQLTSNPRNSEDDMRVPDRLREQLQTLLLDVALSQGPPTAVERAEAARIADALRVAMRGRGSAR